MKLETIIKLFKVALFSGVLIVLVAAQNKYQIQILLTIAMAMFVIELCKK